MVEKETQTSKKTQKKKLNIKENNKKKKNLLHSRWQDKPIEEVRHKFSFLNFSKKEEEEEKNT